MNIVMFTDAYWPRVNGVTVSVDSFSRALVKAGHEVMIICSSYPEGNLGPVGPRRGFPEASGTSPSVPNPEPESQGPVIVRVPSLPIPAFLTQEDRVAKIDKWFWVFRQVEQFNPHIIHINTEFVIAEFGFLYARVHNLPALYTFHTMWEDYGPNYFPMFPPQMVKLVFREMLKNLLIRSYRVIVPTSQIDEVVHKYRKHTKTFLLPTGIETELFEYGEDEIAAYRNKLEETHPRLKGKRILLFAGRVVREKNLGFLLNILPEILARHPDLILLVAGNGPDLDYYKNEALKIGVDAACVFTGYLERGDLAKVYRMAEVFVFPSLTDTQGLVTLEAMFSGTPVVAIGVLGTLMVMGGDNGGFMVKNDAAEFTARVLDLLEDPGLYRRKSTEARDYARHWSIDELTKKLVTIYESTTNDYRKERGDPRTPVWKQLMDKRWWRVTNMIFRKKTMQKWQEMLSKLGW
jgi:glycosyltransferase involved in cell wall biosynthesis